MVINYYLNNIKRKKMRNLEKIFFCNQAFKLFIFNLLLMGNQALSKLPFSLGNKVF